MQGRRPSGNYLREACDMKQSTGQQAAEIDSARSVEMTSVEDLQEGLRAADAVVLATDHSAYAGLDWSAVAGAVVNTRGPRRAGVDVEGSW